MTQDVGNRQVAATCYRCNESNAPVHLELGLHRYYFCPDCADTIGFELMRSSREKQSEPDLTNLAASKGVTN